MPVEGGGGEALEVRRKKVGKKAIQNKALDGKVADEVVRGQRCEVSERSLCLTYLDRLSDEEKSKKEVPGPSSTLKK